MASLLLLMQWLWAFYVLLAQFSLSTCENATIISTWSRLRSDLFDHGYDVTEIPSIGEGIPLPVTVHQTLQAIRDVNEKEQSVIGSSTITVVWEDDRLTWNPSNYSNLTVLTLPYIMVWTPSIDLLNTNFEVSSIPTDPDQTRVHVSYGGLISMETTFRHSTGCPMNLINFPFDTQICTMLITSQDTVTNVVLVPGFFKHRSEDRHPSWNVIGLDGESCSRSDQTSNYEFSDLLVKIKLSRLPSHYIYIIIIPVLLINTLGIWSFFIPIKSGERVSTCISIVLGVTVFQIVVIEVLPQTSRNGSTPNIVKYLTMTFITLVGIMMCSVVTLNLSYQTWRIKGKIGRILFFRILATLVFKRQEGLRMMTDRKVQAQNSDPREDLDKTNDCSFSGETGNNASRVPQSSNSVVSEITDMELVAIIFDRIFFLTFIVVEIWMVFLLKTTFSDQ